MNTICGGGWYSLLLASILAAGVAQAATPRPMAAAITFNTACAGCHEGECSGRLSFKNEVASAVGHIRRFAGPLQDDEVAALFEQLKYMKEHCAYYPLAVPVPHDRVWGNEALQALFSPAGKGYFIPLGLLEPGSYAIELEFGSDADFRFEVLDSQFHFLLERSECTADRKTAAGFPVEIRAQAYLRIFSSSPLQRLRLTEGVR